VQRTKEHRCVTTAVSLDNIRLSPSLTSDDSKFYVTVSYNLNSSITNTQQRAMKPAVSKIERMPSF